MEMNLAITMGQLGMALPLMLGALGSALGILAAGRAAMGEWGKEGRGGKTLRFGYIILMAMPLSQMIYGFVFTLLGLKAPILAGGELALSQGFSLFGFGLACGVIELASAWGQGILGAAGCRTLSDGDGKGMAFIIIAMGIIETVGLFGFVLGYLLLPLG
jgi:V/A-type H+/Na+-transporting ATPase subunit K